jgi:serine/threonine protein kinase
MGESSTEFLGTDRFTIRRRLGSGGMGVVYEAHDREMNKTVALKTLTRAEAVHIYRFKQEFRALADATHPNLVSLYEFMSDGRFWFFTMELVKGVDFLEYVRPGLRALRRRSSESATLLTSLRERSSLDYEADTQDFTDTQPTWTAEKSNVAGSLSDWSSLHLDEDRLRSAFRQLAEGVHGLHEMGKLHRDIKPSNVLVTSGGRVVILDFGLVADVDPAGERASVTLAGTPDYMSPEQGAQLSLTPASDWYSAGVMLYQALTGKLPFSGKFFEVMMNKQSKDPPAPTELRPQTSADLDQLCMKLLQRDPNARPTGREVLNHLNAGPDQSESSKAGLPIAPPTSVTIEAPFVGREKQLDVLREAFRSTASGQCVSLYIHGNSGMGKSALVRHFLDELQEENRRVVVLEGRCYERESVPYKALDGVVDSLSRYLLSRSPVRVAALVPPDASALARLFPVMLQVDAIFDATDTEQEIAEPLALRRRAFNALRELLRRISARRTVVLYIDDLQWADADSTHLLEDLLRSPNAPPLMLIASFRSEDIESKPFLRHLLQQTGGDNCKELAVAPLAEAEAEDLVQRLIGPDALLTQPLLASVVKESRGNPFLLEQLSRYATTGDQAATAGITLAVMLEARLQGLPKGSRRFLNALAVAARPVNPDVAHQAAGLHGDPLRLISALRATQLLRSGGSSYGVELYHDRIRETLIGLLEPAAIHQIHRRLAQTIEARGLDDPEALFEHYLGAGERVRAATHAVAAARRAAAALAFDRAALFYRHAVELTPLTGGALVELKCSLADALANAGRPAEAAPAYLEAAQETSSARALDLRRRAAEQLLMGGHIKEGLAVLRTLLEAVGFRLAAGPRRALLSLLFRRLQIRLRGLEFDERPASQIPDSDLLRIDICWAGAAGLGAVDLIRGADFQAQHLLLALRAGEPYRISRAISFEAVQTASAGGPTRKRAERIGKKAEALAERVGHPHALALSIWSNGVASYLVGNWKQAAVSCERAAEILRDRCTGVTWELTIAHRFMLSALMYLGEVGEISRRVSGLLTAALEQGNLFAAVDLRTRLNLIWLAADKPDEARQEVINALMAWPQEGFHLQHYTSLQALAQIELYTGDAEVALKQITGQWRALEESMLLRFQGLRIDALHLKARTALAVATTAKQPEPLLKTAARLARRIEKEKMLWSAPFVSLIRAGIANTRGDEKKCAELLTTAVAELEAADMSLYAAAARRRLGQTLGGATGESLIVEADGWMQRQTIKNPARLTRMLAPGFKE